MQPMTKLATLQLHHPIDPQKVTAMNQKNGWMHLQHHRVTKVKKQLKVPRSIAAILLRLKAQGERVDEICFWPLIPANDVCARLRDTHLMMQILMAPQATCNFGPFDHGRFVQSSMAGPHVTCVADLCACNLAELTPKAKAAG